MLTSYTLQVENTQQAILKLKLTLKVSHVLSTKGYSGSNRDLNNSYFPNLKSSYSSHSFFSDSIHSVRLLVK